MKQALVIGIVICSLSFGFYHATIHYIPNYIYHKYYSKSTQIGDRKVNEISLINAPDENSRLVVKPNPDFEYGTAFYDVSKNPIRITGSLPDSTYWSVAFYQPNTINFYVKNDLQYKTDELDIILTKNIIDGESAEQIISPTDKGFFLLRVLISERTTQNQERIQNLLKTLKIEIID